MIVGPHIDHVVSVALRYLFLFSIQTTGKDAQQHIHELYLKKVECFEVPRRDLQLPSTKR
jgi:hypothetical protein